MGMRQGRLTGRRAGKYSKSEEDTAAALEGLVTADLQPCLLTMEGNLALVVGVQCITAFHSGFDSCSLADLNRPTDRVGARQVVVVVLSRWEEV